MTSATGCRALGHVVRFASLRSDPAFVADVALTLSTALVDKCVLIASVWSLADCSNLSVRIRACWALGNLCDALVVTRESHLVPAAPDTTGATGPSEGSTCDISREVLVQLVQCALTAARDVDKVRCNAVRALGNFTRFVPPSIVAHETALFEQVVSVLVNSLKHSKLNNPRRTVSVKVRWNAAYALGNLFSNPDLALHRFPWTATALAALNAVMGSTENYKVRINATRALAVPRTRQDYSTQFFPTLLTLCRSLRAISDEPRLPFPPHSSTRDVMKADIVRGHQTSLQTQIASSIVHMISMLQVAPLSSIESAEDASFLHHHEECVRLAWRVNFFALDLMLSLRKSVLVLGSIRKTLSMYQMLKKSNALPCYCRSEMNNAMPNRPALFGDRVIASRDTLSR